MILKISRIIVLSTLNGYVADPDANFDWGVPADDMHTFVNDLERSVGTCPTRCAG
ncbi:MAG: hypothetical protein WD096_07695 [Actinomycetota bacterium]